MGYFDGFKGTVAVVPVTSISQQESYRNQEYLGLYPYVKISGVKHDRDLSVVGNSYTYDFKHWQEVEAMIWSPNS